jgi:hypothetical protein
VSADAAPAPRPGAQQGQASGADGQAAHTLCAVSAHLLILCGMVAALFVLGTSPADAWLAALAQLTLPLLVQGLAPATHARWRRAVLGLSLLAAGCCAVQAALVMAGCVRGCGRCAAVSAPAPCCSCC